MRGDRYDRGWRGHGRDHGGGGRYDRDWTEGFAYGRIPGMAGMPGPFSPYGWDPMMRWSGWDPALGFVPYQDAPPAWGYGLRDDARYDHEYYRGATRFGPGRRGYDRDRVPPRRSPTYGRGGDDALRAWAARRGYDVEATLRPRPRGGW